MGVDIMFLSKFKLQLSALLSDARELRERECSAREELHVSNQRLKLAESEHARRLQELRAELASRNESHYKLETKLKVLENENALLENKERELKETISNLLQSKDDFVKCYEDSTCALKRTVEMRDRQVAVLSKKIQDHILLLDTIGKEAALFKHVVDNVHHLVEEKEQIVAVLRGKIEKISVFEEEFSEKLSLLEKRLIDCQCEIQKRDSTISELKEHLEVEKIRSCFQPEVEELRKSSFVKEETIQKLVLEKQMLYFELKNMETIQKKVEEVIINLTAQRELPSALTCEEILAPNAQVMECLKDAVQIFTDNSSPKDHDGGTREEG